MKCEDCGITIPEMPEDATPSELLCDSCCVRYENAYFGPPCKFCGEHIDDSTHQHQRKPVCVDCWDERLATTA